MDTGCDTFTAEYGLSPAPGGLCAAQEYLNTGLPHEADRDPLAGGASATAWLQRTLREWSLRSGQDDPHSVVLDRDLPELRTARVGLREWVRGAGAHVGGAGGPLGSTATFTLADGQCVTYGPGPGGGAGLLAIVVVELLLAARSDTLRRLKVCANDECSVTFYDESRNVSRRWHDVRSCGNSANLRASRARRAAAQASPSEGKA